MHKPVAPFTSTATKGLLWIKTEDQHLYFNSPNGTSINISSAGAVAASAETKATAAANSVGSSVSLTGSQTIAGTKTFSNIIVSDISGNASNCNKRRLYYK